MKEDIQISLFKFTFHNFTFSMECQVGASFSPEGEGFKVPGLVNGQNEDAIMFLDLVTGADDENG